VQHKWIIFNAILVIDLPYTGIDMKVKNM